MLYQMKSGQRAAEARAWARHRKWYESLTPEQKRRYDERSAREDRWALAITAAVLAALAAAISLAVYS